MGTLLPTGISSSRLIFFSLAVNKINYSNSKAIFLLCFAHSILLSNPLFIIQSAVAAAYADASSKKPFSTSITYRMNF